MTVDQANMLLFPIEIARIISVLIHGTDHAQNKEKALKQVNTAFPQIMSETLIKIAFSKVQKLE